MWVVKLANTVLTYNYSVEEESQDPKTTENQEKEPLEMASTPRLQAVYASSDQPTC
jgi:hypothetical protein